MTADSVTRSMPSLLPQYVGSATDIGEAPTGSGNGVGARCAAADRSVFWFSPVALRQPPLPLTCFGPRRASSNQTHVFSEKQRLLSQCNGSKGTGPPGQSALCNRRRWK